MTAIRGSSSERPTAIAVAASGGESATTMTTTTTTTTTTTPSSQNQQASTKEEGKATGEVAVQQSPITDALNSSELAPDSPAGALLRKMDAELTAARRAIKEKDATLERLSRLQSAVDGEIQDLTEKLFQEAYAMVNKAEERRALAERLLAESRMKNDVLLAEVEALKILVRQNSVATTTSPGRLFSRQTDAWSSSGGSSILSSAKHGLAVRFLGQSKISPDRRSSASTSAAQQPLIPGSPQHKSSFPGTALSTPLSRKQTACARTVSNDEDEQGRGDEELDPQLYADFVTWRDEGFPLDDQSSASSASFSRQLEDADIAGCMQFQNAELSTRVLAAIRSNRLELEPTSVQSVCECALSRVPRLCVYRMRLEENSEWMPVSLLARNRIVAVGDLYTYVRYLRELASAVKQCLATYGSYTSCKLATLAASAAAKKASKADAKWSGKKCSNVITTTACATSSASSSTTAASLFGSTTASSSGATPAPGAVGNCAGTSTGTGSLMTAAAMTGTLNYHNDMRAKILAGTYQANNTKLGPAASLPPMTWNCTLAASAQTWANGCVFQHDSNRGNVGENIYELGPATPDVLAAFSFPDQLGINASTSWDSEFKNNAITTLVMDSGTVLNTFGHATQMAWSTSTQVGCGVATPCSVSGGQVMSLVVCRYAPPGNFVGQQPFQAKCSGAVASNNLTCA